MVEPVSHRLRNLLWTLCVFALVLWLGWIGWHRWWRPVLLTALAAAAFLLGTLAGFVFTSYSEEADTIGKVKDWLVGALAGLTILEFHSIKGVLLLFAVTNTAYDYGLTVAIAIVFSGLGFFAMFFGREFVFNVPLARVRAERGRIDHMEDAGVVTLKLLAAIPPSLLSGSDDLDAIESDSAETTTLKEQLAGKDVQTFLDQSQEALEAGAPLDWDVVSKVAYLRYYRAFFADQSAGSGQYREALDWIERALFLNPKHVDFTAKRAQVLAWLERWQETVAILEVLYARTDCPVYIEQWLGFYLLYLPGREDEAIALNQDYLRRFPTRPEARQNLASAFAQKVCREPRAAGAGLNQNSPDYRAALEQVKAVVVENPAHLKVMRTDWIGPKGSFNCFAQDDGYLAAVGLGTQIPPVQVAEPGLKGIDPAFESDDTRAGRNYPARSTPAME